ncbi:unnamed protein product [Sphagnum jensenii]|uniref:LOB domain-containing protein n=1 Tax=Sphagnum jensenii TaxID=128206 RepID=A0ABP1AXZ8_9BRYO
MASSSSSSPCAACKFLRRKCTSECVFAPYFPPDQPQKFANVHKIFGASNISKLLNELSPHQREDAVNSLAYEADARVKDPVYGCVGAISLLQRQVAQLQNELAIAHSDLARYSAAASTPAADATTTSSKCRDLRMSNFTRLHYDFFSFIGISIHMFHHISTSMPPMYHRRDIHDYHYLKFCL